MSLHRDGSCDRETGFPHQSVCPQSYVREIRSLSPRLVEALRQLHGLSYDDLRTLLVFVREVLVNQDQRRAQDLQQHIGERCDIGWPGQLEVNDALLTAVDSEKAVATVERFPDVKRHDVPVRAVFLRPPDQPTDSRDEHSLPLPAVSKTTASRDANDNVGTSSPGAAA